MASVGLEKYDQLLGCWKPCGEYGGLVHVQYEGDSIKGYGLFPGSEEDVMESLHRQLLFTIGVNADKEVMVQCQQPATSGPHPCVIDVKSSNNFKFECTSDQCKQSEQSSLKWQVRDGGAWWNLDCERVHIPERGVPMQPGLFKGDYGPHGIELILVSYDAQHKEAFCTKISGDPNIPAGKITIKADLTRPMVLTTEQQNSVKMLAMIDIQEMSPGVATKPLPRQPFQLPIDCEGPTSVPPASCIARYHSQGQVAQHGYVDPSFIPGHWIVFDENTFGNIWIDGVFIIYSRCTENFSTVAKA